MPFRIPLPLVLPCVLAAAGLGAPVLAGSLSGTASIRARIALPPDAVFEAVLIDAALADAPARVLGRWRLQPAGQPPFRFTIPYRDQDLSPHGRYAVQASVRQGERLLFTTDTFNPVLLGRPNPPLQLKMVAVEGRDPGGQRGPLGRLPASWRGDLPGAGGGLRWQVDLEADGSFQLRQIPLGRPQPQRWDDIGRWRLEPPRNRLVLRGGREAPLFFQPLEKGAALQLLDPQGGPIRPRQQDRLPRLAAADPIEPQLPLLGMFQYQADAARIRLCATGASLPVAMEGDYRRLERAYLRAQGSGGAAQPLLVNLEGRIGLRPSLEPWGGMARTLVVERFITVHPGRNCGAEPSQPAR